VHIRDVMRLSRVVVAVQRFKRAAQQLTPGGPAQYPQGYLAIYENTDPVQMTADHKYMLSDEMPISIEPGAEKAGFAEWYTDVRFPALMKLPGMVSGSVSQAAAHQMPGVDTRPEFVAVYRTTDLAGALKGWAQVSTAGAPWDPAGVSVGCFTPIIDRVTLTQVMDPDPLSRDTAKQKREAMGNRRHMASPAMASR
jgi:hypothetical protein